MRDAEAIEPSAMSIDQPSLSPQRWRELGLQLSRRRGSLEADASRQMWEVGDWLLAGEDVVLRHLKRAEIRRVAAEVTGYSRRTLDMAVWLARRFGPTTRMEGLSWTHHTLVARLAPAEREQWLLTAAREAWSVRELRARLRPSRQPVSRPTMPRLQRAVVQLTSMRREEIDAPLVHRLREWWLREMGEVS
jgi:hypothetical protein